MIPLVAYYQARCGDFEQALHEISHRISPEAIHRLRVAVKQMRALFHLIDTAAEAFGFDEKFALFKETFKAAATIRDLEITMSLIKKIADKKDEHTDELLILLKKKERERVPQLKRVASAVLERGNIFSEEIAEIIRTILNEEHILNFLVGTKQEIDERIAKHPSAENLHTIRKLLKEYVYISSTQTSSTDYKTLDTVQHLLGIWHDVIIANDVIDELIVSDGNNKKFALQIKRTLKREEEHRRAAAVKALEEVWSGTNDH